MPESTAAPPIRHLRGLHIPQWHRAQLSRSVELGLHHPPASCSRSSGVPLRHARGPGVPEVVRTQSGYPDRGAQLAHARGDSRYYLIVAVNIAGQRSLPSDRTGLFPFALAPGGAG